MHRFDLGDKPPIANGVKAYVGDAVGEEAIIEVDFQWCVAALAVHVHTDGPHYQPLSLC